VDPCALEQPREIVGDGCVVRAVLLDRAGTDRRMQGDPHVVLRSSMASREWSSATACGPREGHMKPDVALDIRRLSRFLSTGIA
jgi:hypothetical protein